MNDTKLENVQPGPTAAMLEFKRLTQEIQDKLKRWMKLFESNERDTEIKNEEK